ncbi:DNA recombination protein RmuC [Alterisphingorhabdus coralli]|uniref:DNA recombination protein RmuC homolog n=1 Tax=Alterisphingorhabdus coralli TaxID=3071408 RepID=A0AA97F5G8_9SPHN|nr:DNA recombination protein RmuC [Parasphingorhabdus sp. SCSIO 66989]WOE73791.1 DNA recombination protein RmuC [Parasphingorhabdus sp. SCSIO 66989]
MSEQLLPVIIGIVTLIIGVILGWFFGGRPAAAARAEKEALDAELKALNEKFQSAISDLATESEKARKAEELSRQCDTLRSEREGLSTENARLKADAANHDRQLKQLREAREELSSQFGEVGNKLLGEAQKQFLERADQRFAQSEEKNEARIKALLNPVGEKLHSYEQQIERIEKQRSEAYGDLKGLMDQMRSGQQQVRDETARLVNSLRNAPKARGRWGEQQLKNVLESCGLAEYTDFVMEHSIETEEGRLRPDAVVRVPGGRSLVIDAKVSLNAYQDAFEADDDEARSVALAAHGQSMRTHIDGLSRKAYWDQFEDAPDYVIMFVPGEHFLSAALEHDAGLWDFAFEKKVLLATPTNLVAIARTVAGVWRQEGLAREAKQIGALGKEMYDRLAVSAEHLKRVGAGLNSAVGNYNKFVGSFERNVLSTGRKFQQLNIETGKRDLEELPEIEALPRYGNDEQDEAAE